jgi:hypothetical protein
LGVYLNIFLMVILLVIIICVSRSGGLCVNGEGVPNPFNLHPLGTCTECKGNIVDGLCEVCTDAVDQCYFQYS